MRHKLPVLIASFVTLSLLIGSCARVDVTPTTEATTVPPTTLSLSDQSITTNGGAVIPLSSLEYCTNDVSSPVVYYISDISPEAMIKIYEALEWSPSGTVAIKLSTGEPPSSNYLDPELIKDLVQSLDGTIVECNTAYEGSRDSTEMHMQVAEDHGYTAIAEVDIMDAEGSESIPVTGGTHLTENLVGTHFFDYDSFVVLSHFKGHQMAGFGGAIKNISIGIASAKGKENIHTAGEGGSIFTAPQDPFLESMAEAGKSVSDYLGEGEQIVYINVMNHLSIDCDCNGYPATADIHDIGILASTDPVALDQACIDLVYVSDRNYKLVTRIEKLNGLLTLEHAAEIGLGSRSYVLVDIGE